MEFWTVDTKDVNELGWCPRTHVLRRLNEIVKSRFGDWETEVFDESVNNRDGYKIKCEFPSDISFKTFKETVLEKLSGEFELVDKKIDIRTLYLDEDKPIRATITVLKKPETKIFVKAIS